MSCVLIFYPKMLYSNVKVEFDAANGVTTYLLRTYIPAAMIKCATV